MRTLKNPHKSMEDFFYTKKYPEKGIKALPVLCINQWVFNGIHS